MPILKLNLLENCFSFANESIKKACEAETDIKEWKFCILFLVQSIELALKERLRREHAILIFEKIDSPKITVSIDTAKMRIQKIAGITLSENDLTAIDRGKEVRNNIVHFEFEIDTESIKILFSSLIGFLNEFISKHLNENLDKHIEPNLWAEVLKIESHVKVITERAIQRIISEGIGEENIWTCPRCDEDTFITIDRSGECYICHYTDDVVICESCGNDILTGSSFEIQPDSDVFLCDNCYYEYAEDGYLSSFEDEHY